MGITMLALAKQLTYKYDMLHMNALAKHKQNTCQYIYMGCMRDANIPPVVRYLKPQADAR